MKKILITGGAGYIGSKLATKLIRYNYEVTIIDSLKFSSKSINHLFKNKNFHFVKLDLLDIKKIKNLFKNIDMVFHLAANADVRYGIDNPKKDLEQNTIVTFNILESMRVNGVKKIIFF